MSARRTLLAACAAALLVASAGCRTFEARDPDAGTATTSTDATAAAADAERDGRSGAATEDPFERARRLIDEAQDQPPPPGNYKVDVQRIWLHESAADAWSALVGYEDENVQVQVGAPPPVDPGFVIAGAKDGWYGAAGVLRQSGKVAGEERTFLLVVPERAGSLQVGQVRYAIPFDAGAVSGAVLVPQGQFVGTSLDVVVRSAGPGLAEVALTPAFSELSGGGRTMHLTQATTTVLAPIGRPFVIASRGQETNSVANAILSRRTERAVEQGVLILTVTGG